MSEIEQAKGCGMRCGMLMVAAVLLLSSCWFGWEMVKVHEGLRVEVLAAGIVGGLGATACLAGVMHFLDEMAEGGGFRWQKRWLVGAIMRILFLMELAATGLALAAAGILIFGFKIPGVHATMGGPV